jgi:glyoxylase-like metal-dependent hydrolase (beta-lactamase superfamily II)
MLIDGKTHPDLNCGVEFFYSNGHTEGLLMPYFHLNEGPLVFPSDLVPGSHWVHLPIVMGYDRFAELIVDEKAKLLSLIAEKNGSVVFTHDPHVKMARIRRHNDKFSAH